MKKNKTKKNDFIFLQIIKFNFFLKKNKTKRKRKKMSERLIQIIDWDDSGRLQADGKTICLLSETSIRLISSYVSNNVDINLSQQEQRNAMELIRRWFDDRTEKMIESTK